MTYDITPPSNPTAPATEQNGAQNNTWQNFVSSTTFEWSGYSDNLTGIDGFYWYFGLSVTGISTNYTTTNTISPSTAENDTYYFRIMTRDKAGNNASWTTLFVFKHDAQSPTSTIKKPSTDPAYYNTKPIWLNGTCSDELSGVNRVEIKIVWKDNGTVHLDWNNTNLAINCSWWDYEFNPPNEANFTIYIRAVDNASNYQASISINITYDKTPPTTTITLVGTLGTNGWYLSDVIVNLTATDGLSNVLYIKNSTNYASFGIYTGDFTLTADGICPIQYYAVDNAGNVESTQLKIVKTDKIKPEPPQLITPNNDTWVNTSSVLFNWQDSSDSHSGIANYTLQVSKTPDFSYLNYTAINLTTTVNTSQQLDDGIYYWRVIVNDNASNSNVSEVWIVKIDTEKPGVVTLIYPGTEVPEIADNTPPFEWEEVIDPLSGVAYYEIQVDDNIDFSSPEYWDNSTTNTSTPITSLDDATYRFRVRAVDNAKNKGDWSEKRGFVVKSGAPTGLKLKINNDAIYTNSTNVILTISVDNPTSFYLMCFSNDGYTWSGWESYTASKDWNLVDYGGNSTEGNKIVYVRCKKSEYAPPEIVAQAVDTIKLDLTSPVVTLQLPLNDVWVNYSLIEFKWKAWDNFELSGNYHIQIWNYDKDEIIHESSVAGSTASNGTSTYSHSLPDGKYWWRVKGEDKANNWCDFTNYWLIKIDTAPPSSPLLYKPINNEVITEMDIRFEWQNLSLNDSSGIYQYELRVDINIFYIHGQNNFTTLLLSDGAYNWKVRAVDIAGNIGEFSETRSFTIDRKGPKNVRFFINGDAIYTNIEHVYLSVYAGNTAWMRFSNDSENWTEWETYTITKEWNLSYAEEGSNVSRTVYLECKSWNDVTSPVVSDSIILDKRPPFVHILNESQTINRKYFVLGWYSEYSVLRYDISTNGADWTDVGKNTTWNFTSLKECINVLYVRGVAFDGTSGGPDSLGIFVDTKKPIGISLEINSNAQFTNSATVELRLKAQDYISEGFASGLWKIYLWDDEGVEEIIEINISKIFDPINTTMGWTLSGDDGSKTVWLKVVDKAGNEAIINATIFLDRVKPVNLNITIPYYYTNSTTISLNISADDPTGSGLWQMCFKEEGGNWGSWVYYSEKYNYQLQSTTDGLKNIYFKVRDKAGNENYTFAQIIIDNTKPELISLTITPLTEDSTYFNITVTIIENNLGMIAPNLIYRIGDGSWNTVQMKLLSGKTFYFNITAVDFNASQGDYLHYKVQCSDLAGNINTSTECSEYISPIPDTPELTTPGDYAIITTNITTLRWTKNSTDSNWYFVEYWVVIEYYNATTGGRTCLVNQTTYDTHIMLSELKHNVTYYWTVRAVNGSLQSPWSKTREFTLKFPDLCITQADITFYPAHIVSIDTKVTINITVWNLGESDAENVLIKFFYKYPPIDPRTLLIGSIIVNVKKGELTNASLRYPYELSEEKFRIYVWLDPDDLIAEIREDNNLNYSILEVVGKLDVLPTNITFSVNGVEPSYIFEDDPVIITAEIINLGGDIKIPFWVEFWFGDFENNIFNGSLIDRVQVEKILTDGIKSVSINWNAEVGDYKIWVFLNTTKLPNENAENNWFNKTFTVNFPTLITISPSPSLLTTDPSGTLSYTITVTNIGRINDTYNLTVEDLPSGWDYSFIYNNNEIKNVTLEMNETIKVMLRVKSSDKPGTYHFRVVASSQKDPRAVYDIELTAKIKEPFPWYLLIIAVIAAVIIAVIGLLVKKVVIAVKTKPAVKIEQGYNYLIKGTDVRKAYSVFIQLMKKAPGLCITSTHPRKRRDEYKLECPVYWLTDVTKTDEKTLHPERLDFELFKTVSEFAKERHGIVMLDGLEYLVHVNGFGRTMDSIDSIMDAISTHNGTLVVPVNPSVFKEGELAMVEKKFDRIIIG
jgi:uncharacterized repeat protein (TIGR01451 family)